MKSLLIPGLLLGLAALATNLKAEYAVSITVSGNSDCFFVLRHTPTSYMANAIRLARGNHVLSLPDQIAGHVLTSFEIIQLNDDGSSGHTLYLPMRHHYTVVCNVGETPQALD